MAIVVEEEKKNGVDLVRLIGWLAIIGTLGAAIYYIFFAAPQLVTIQPATGFQTITPLSKVTLHPEDVLNSQAFQTLKSPSFTLPSAQGPSSMGRSNPFIAP